MKLRGNSWRDVTPGGLIPWPGNSRQYETGDWRTRRPIWHKDRCIQCYRCWVYCPDSAITIKDSKVAGIDYDHCKGCGICAAECPDKVVALEMIGEEEAIQSVEGFKEAKSDKEEKGEKPNA